MEATPEQRQTLIEHIFKRNHLRRKFGMTPLDIDLAYAQGLNRILRKNLTKTSDGTLLNTDKFDAIVCEIINLEARRRNELNGGSVKGQ